MHPLFRAHLAVFPPACRHCGRMMEPLAGILRGRPPGFPHLCGLCHESLPFYPGAPLQPPPGVDALWAASRYAPPVSDWIRAFKYGAQDGLAPLLGALLAGTAGAGLAPGADWMVVPVPLHPLRLRRRGFNQSWLLAHRWWRALDNPKARRPALRPGLLRRSRMTLPQVELDARSRAGNVAGAFEPASAAEARDLPGGRVLLIDDVTTTGATLADCARALKAAGAVRVEALVVAAAESILPSEVAA